MEEANTVTKENIKNIFCTKNIIWFLTVILMVVSICIAFFGGPEKYIETVKRGVIIKKDVETMKTAANPFMIGPLAALFGCAFYSIICLRCRNEVSIYNENKIDIKMLYCILLIWFLLLHYLCLYQQMSVF